jgi:two-component system sensor histidine kinase UhpB
MDGAVEGAGVKGMRERAVLAGASLEIGPSGRGGTEVCLEVPADARARNRTD